MNTIEQRRLKAGLTQAQLADRVGCAQTTIARIEKGAPTRKVLLSAIERVLADEPRPPPQPSRIQESSGAYSAPGKTDLSVSQSALAELIKRLDLQAQIIDSQRQTIAAQNQTIATLNTMIAELKES